MNDFYLTIHSDQSSFVGMENHASCFRAYLGHELLLHGKWEVGLAEVFYPMTIRVLTRKESFVFVEYFDSTTGESTDVNFLELAHDEHGMVSLENYNFFLFLRDELKKHGIETLLEDKSRITFSAKPKTRKLIFGEKMRQILGMKNNTYFLDPSAIGVYGINGKRCLPQQVVVSTDIISHQMIGGSYDQVLRVFNVDSEKYNYGCTGYERFENIHYFPVNHEKIDDVQIYIKDRLGNCISFESGTSTVILHFRKVSDE
jgi:hypothetical protein